MEDEFYHKDIFGTVVDVSLNTVNFVEKPILGKKNNEFNIFLITDALGARNKKDAWVLYQKALSSGLSAEEIFFRLFWQVKSMIIATKTKNVGETDMKPFPYNKAKSYSKNFKLDELEKLSEDLVTGYTLARHGEGEVETLIEKILLKL